MRIVISGTSSGIGRYLAARLCEARHEIWGIARRSQAEFASERRARGESFRYTQVDVSNWAEVQKWRDALASEWKSIDALICCAGVQGPLGPSMGLSPAEWERSININLNGTFYTLLGVHPLLRRAERRAKVVCFSGGGSAFPRAFFTPYAAAKAGIVRMVENLAQEWTDTPIDINALAPGAVNTGMTDEVVNAGPKVVGFAEHSKAMDQIKKGGTPLQRVGEAVDYLISQESDGVTGRLISGLWDDYRSFRSWLDELRGSDVYTLRRIVPADRQLKHS